MSHIDTYPTVAGYVRSADASLLDDIEAALPGLDDDVTGATLRLDRTANDDGTETLSGFITFDPDDTTDVTAEQAAQRTMDAIRGHPLADQADDWAVRQYRTPTGGVSTDEVRAWYEANPEAQPTDDDGEPFIPSTWDPLRHLAAEETGP